MRRYRVSLEDKENPLAGNGFFVIKDSAWVEAPNMLRAAQEFKRLKGLTGPVELQVQTERQIERATPLGSDSYMVTV